MLRHTDHAQAVVGQLHVVAAGQEQVTLAILADRVARIDVLAQADVDRFAPRAADVVGPDHVVAAGGAFGPAGAGREVDVVAAVVPDDVRRPDRTDVLRDRVAQRLPVDQVARVPDRQPGIGVERGRREVVVVAVLEHGRIGPVAGEHRVEEGAVAQVGTGAGSRSRASSDWRACRRQAPWACPRRLRPCPARARSSRERKGRRAMSGPWNGGGPYVCGRTASRG